MRRLVVDLHARASAWSLSADVAQRIRAAAPAGWEVCFVEAPTVSDGDGGSVPSDEVLRAVRGAEAYFGFGISPALFAVAQGLRWVHSASAGVGRLLFPEMLASSVVLTNSAGVHAVPMAEYALGGILFLLRSFDAARELQRARSWDKEAFVGRGSTIRELRDCEVLVLGAGGIGAAIAQRLSLLGSHCTGVRRRPELGAPEGFDTVVGPGQWEEFLPRTDVLVVSAPGTAETETIVSAAVLDRLPEDAIVVNVARGSLVDEQALADRIARGRLRGAVLDVFREEPLPADSPLWGLSSVLLTPHVSAVSPRGFWERQSALFIDNWHRYVEGREMLNVVDREAGY